MIYDCFTFFNELDLLEIRFNELYNTVDKFVLVEAETSFSGKPKQLIFENNKERFASFLDKVIHIKIPAEDMPKGDDPWIREYFQRQSITLGLKDAKDSDLIILSDVDEIPKSHPIEFYSKYKTRCGVNTLYMRMYRIYLNSYTVDHKNWNKVKICTYEVLKNIEYNTEKLRHLQNVPVLPNAGWHFSSVGNIDYLLEKYSNFSHYRDTDINPQDWKEKLANDQFLDNNNPLIFEKNLDNLPKYVQENKELFIKRGLLHE